MKLTSHIVIIGILALVVAGCSSRGHSARSDSRDDRFATQHAPRPEPTMGTHTDAGYPGDRTMAGTSAGASRLNPPGSESSQTAMAVRERLIQEGTVDSNRVRVYDDRGTIYLNGAVDSSSQKMRAEQVATGTPGVSTVINQLEIGPGQTGQTSNLSSRETLATGNGRCTLVARIPGAKSDPAFTSVQLRVWDDPYYRGGSSPAHVEDVRSGRIREERTQSTTQDLGTSRVTEERRVVEERPGYTSDAGHDGARQVIWSGWIRQGDRVNISAPHGPIRYDYRFAADDKFHGDKWTWCNNGAYVAVP